jgi:hypothetical protein
MSDSIFGDVICSYSRAQAIEDEVLFDITDEAKEAGFKIPTAMTAGVYDAVGDDEGAEGVKGMLTELFCAVRYAKNDRVNFTFKGAEMYAVIGPGDTRAPVLTIMLIGED